MIRVEAPLETVPLFVRGGAILPMGPEMNYVGEKPAGPVQFEIYPDARGKASTLLYEDDGLTEDYQQGSFRQTSLSYRHTPAGGRIDLGAPKGSYRPPHREFVFTIRPENPAGKAVSKTVLQVLIDGNRQARAASAGYPTVRIADDGQRHRIQWR